MMEVEFQQLDMRYESMRSAQPQREKRLLASLLEHGQQTPVVVIGSGEANRFVLIDGYKRVRALKKTATDTVRTTQWDLCEADALMFERLLRMDQEDSAIEQGQFLRTLIDGFGLTPVQLAKRLDKSESWVSRRLGLVKALPQAALELVHRGSVCAHAAEKFLVPLARAKNGDCVAFAQAVGQAKYSVRQVGELYRGLTSGSAKTRQLVLQNPTLFLEAQAAAASEKKKDKPALELVLDDLSILAAVCRRIERRLLDPLSVLSAIHEQESIGDAFAVARASFEKLSNQLQRSKDARPGDAHGDPEAA